MALDAVVEFTTLTSMLDVFAVLPIMTVVPAARAAGTIAVRVTVVVPAVVAEAVSVPDAAPRAAPEQTYMVTFMFCNSIGRFPGYKGSPLNWVTADPPIYTGLMLP